MYLIWRGEKRQEADDLSWQYGEDGHSKIEEEIRTKILSRQYYFSDRWAGKKTRQSTHQLVREVPVSTPRVLRSLDPPQDWSPLLRDGAPLTSRLEGGPQGASRGPGPPAPEWVVVQPLRIERGSGDRRLIVALVFPPGRPIWELLLLSTLPVYLADIAASSCTLIWFGYACRNR